jgi:hypothetical protein
MLGAYGNIYGWIFSAYGYILMHMDVYMGGCRVHIGIYGCIWLHMVAYGCIWVHMGAYEYIMVFRDDRSYLSVSMKVPEC